MEKSRSKLFFSLLIAIAFLFLVLSCGGGENKEQQNPEEHQMTVLCDDAIYDLMKVPFHQFDSIFTMEKVTVQRSSAFQAMARFLAGEVKSIVLARDYTHLEDSLMESHGVEKHVRKPMAYDALVFYISVNSKLDTMADSQIKDILNNKASGFLKYYPKLGEEPEFVSNGQYSSEYENLKQIMTGKKAPAKPVKFFQSCDSVKKYVLNHSNAVGVGYLSQIIHEPDLKPIRFSFTDSAGNYIFPHVVHQANVLRGLYPYKVTYYVYIYDKINDLQLKFERFLSISRPAQRYFLDAGVVPAFGDFILKPAEE